MIFVLLTIVFIFLTSPFTAIHELSVIIPNVLAILNLVLTVVVALVLHEGQSAITVEVLKIVLCDVVPDEVLIIGVSIVTGGL
jgi:hypothetical protein